ncbi:MAG: hypothetical protein KC649_01005 [Candidatus Omnitrophica bacterium]|nr:hypothetical protein [Candidatus Omnitrophota bacterium]
MLNKKNYLLILFLSGMAAVACAEPEMPASVHNEIQVLRRTVDEFRATLEEQAQVIRLQGEQIRRLTRQTEAVLPVASAAAAPSVSKWTPEIGIIGDMVAKFDSPKEDEEGADRLSVRELELVFGSAVDPYSRFDSTISFSDFEDSSLEEAYLTHFALPWEMTGRFGKMKPRIGKALSVHRDSLETVDEPLVIQRYFGVEGYNKAGADFTRGFDLNWPLPQEITFGVLEGGNGEEGTLFGESRRRPTVYSHLETFADISDLTGFEFGVSHLSGSKDEDPSLETQVIGLDATLNHSLNSVQKLKLQSEFFYVYRQESNLDPDESTDLRINDTPWGFYALADFKFAPQWSAGFRYDMVELIDSPIGDPDDTDTGYTGYVTFYQSEFARWRAQFTFLDKSDDTHDSQVLLQGTFAIGEHKHKIN